MNTPLGDLSGPFDKMPSRCKFQKNALLLLTSESPVGDELKQTVSIVVDIASVLDPDGVDVYFLNREPLFHVRSSAELIPVFAVPPAGRIYQRIRSF